MRRAIRLSLQPADLLATSLDSSIRASMDNEVCELGHVLTALTVLIAFYMDEAEGEREEGLRILEDGIRDVWERKDEQDRAKR